MATIELVPFPGTAVASATVAAGVLRRDGTDRGRERSHLARTHLLDALCPYCPFQTARRAHSAGTRNIAKREQPDTGSAAERSIRPGFSELNDRFLEHDLEDTVFRELETFLLEWPDVRVVATLRSDAPGTAQLLPGWKETGRIRISEVTPFTLPQSPPDLTRVSCPPASAAYGRASGEDVKSIFPFFQHCRVCGETIVDFIKQHDVCPYFAWDKELERRLYGFTPLHGAPGNALPARPARLSIWITTWTTHVPVQPAEVGESCSSAWSNKP